MICASPDFLALALLAIGAVARPLAPKPSDVSVTLDGKTYINKGLVAFGLIPNNAIESTGDTIGGIGSAIALSSFGSLGNGSFSGTLIVQPDRGYNVESTIDYQGRQLAIDFLLTPYTESAELSFQNALSTLRLTYKSTLLYTDRDNIATTGLDAQGVRPGEEGFPSATRPDANPPVPIPSSTNNRLSLDLEGIVLNEDGSFWISDEYGPYIYRYSLQGDIIQTIQPPEAILPLDAKGELDFTSVTDPVTGRSANQGFEGLTVSGDKKTLYALLQSGTVQDGESQYTRLLAFDVSDPAVRPTPTGEWVVPLPTSKKGKVRAASEVHFVSENIFLALSRDGHGRGGGTDEDDLDSSYKQADLFSITKATNILGKYDNPANPVAPDGVLLSSVTPATYVSFVDYVDDTQLARFGLHNGEPDDQTLLNAKWESLALASAMDPDYPEDYFLFTASDNDFLSENGIFDGQAFDAGENVDNQFLVFRVTLPGATIGDLA